MSRREDRSPDARRRRNSRFDREPSPKRSRRDGNVEIERTRVDNDSDKGHTVQDVKQHRRFEDVEPHEASLVNEPMVETGTVSKESDRKNDRYEEGVKESRPRSYFQHDDRATAGKNGRSLNRKEDRERGWWRDSKEQQFGHEEVKTTANNTQQKDEKTKENKEDHRVWRHDGYFEMEANSKRPEPSMRKRPAFREQKISTDPEKTSKIASDPVNPNHNHDIRSGHRDDRARNRAFERDREVNRTNTWNSGRDRYNGGVNRRYRGRDRFSGGGQSYRSSGNRVEKWKHDLYYTETNRSPTPKNEEDQIAKVEALLSS